MHYGKVRFLFCHRWKRRTVSTWIYVDWNCSTLLRRPFFKYFYILYDHQPRLSTVFGYYFVSFFSENARRLQLVRESIASRKVFEQLVPPIPPNGRHEEFPVAANTGPESTKRNNDPIFVWHDILLCTTDGGGGGCGCGGGCRLLYVPVFVAAVKKSFGSACYDDKL